MTARRTLLLDRPDEAPWASPDLLGQMRCVMWDERLGRWDARARNCEAYGHGATASEAMAEAVRFRDAPRVERRRLEE